MHILRYLVSVIFGSLSDLDLAGRWMGICHWASTFALNGVGAFLRLLLSLFLLQLGDLLGLLVRLLCVLQLVLLVLELLVLK